MLTACRVSPLCAVREELRMYNPDYCARPHVVALNKVDLLTPQAEAGAGTAGEGGAGGQQAAAGRTPPHLVPLVGAWACC